MNSYVNKVIFFFSLTFVIAIVIISGSFYMLTNNSFSNKNIVVETKKIKTTFLANSDSLENIIPMSYNEGMINGSNIKLKVENISEDNITYKIRVDNNKNNEISFDKIYYRINNETPKLLSYNDGYIFSGKIKPYSFDELSIKIWIASELIDNSDQGKKSDLKIIVE